jgi:hypothetical protein
VPLGQVAHHLKHAGRLDDWADAAEQAARQAVNLGNDGEAGTGDTNRYERTRR